MPNISRREFLKVSAIVASSLMVSTGLSGCNDDEEVIAVTFDHGVASGDPLSDKVIIWTRVTPSKEEDLEKEIAVNYEVATDENFSKVVHNGQYKTDKEKDFTVKIDLQNLEAATPYYYRFKSGTKTSESGIAKTLPTDTPEQVKFAVFSCANYPKGYFNVYTQAAKMNDLDVSIHIGDYIYEYGMYKNDDFEAKIPAYATQNAEAIGRVLPDDNNTELLTLSDYRKRYALYKTDSGLQAIHKACPMIVVWDDHEIANDAYKDGAENHSDSEGDYATRTENALQAYFEWLPIRPIANKKEIYRSFNFGGLVNLHMLETRILARDKQLNYADYYTPAFDAVSFTTDLTNTSRTMLGTSQLTWLQGQLQNSTATWDVLGQQVLMGKMTLPAEILTPIGMLDNPEAFGTTTEVLLTQIDALMAELAILKVRALQGDPTLTDSEKARINTVLPYNLDSWDGYFAERETIFATAKALQKNLVVLAGDTHNSWASNLTDMNGDQVGVEFATASVSSPGLEEYLSLPDSATSAQFEEALKLLIDDLHYTNTYDRGFMTVTFTAENVTTEWSYVNTNNSTTYTLNDSRQQTITAGTGSELKLS